MIPKASLVCVYKISSDHTILCLSGYPNMFIVCLQYTEYENCCWPSVNIIKPNLILPRLSGSSEQHSLVGVFHKYYWNCSLPVPRPVRRSVGRLGWLVCHNFLKGQWCYNSNAPCFALIPESDFLLPLANGCSIALLVIFRKEYLYV